MSKKLMLKDVRIQYPVLFEPRENKLSGKREYSARLIMPEGHAGIEAIKAAMNELFKDKFGANADKKLKKALGNDNTKFLRFDDDRGWYYINVKRRDTDGAPTVVDRARKRLEMASGLPRGGDFVNALVEVWVYDNQSTGTSATLLGVQYAKEGEPLSAVATAKTDDFEDLGAGEDAVEDFM